MDFSRMEARYRHLEMATDAAVLLQELEWEKSGLGDEDLAPEYAGMFRKLKALGDRSLTEALEYTDPKALFDLVRYAKHLGMWKGYHKNQGRLRYVELDAGVVEEDANYDGDKTTGDAQPESDQMTLGFEDGDMDA